MLYSFKSLSCLKQRWARYAALLATVASVTNASQDTLFCTACNRKIIPGCNVKFWLKSQEWFKNLPGRNVCRDGKNGICPTCALFMVRHENPDLTRAGYVQKEWPEWQKSDEIASGWFTEEMMRPGLAEYRAGVAAKKLEEASKGQTSVSPKEAAAENAMTVYMRWNNGVAPLDPRQFIEYQEDAGFKRALCHHDTFIDEEMSVRVWKKYHKKAPQFYYNRYDTTGVNTGDRHVNEEAGGPHDFYEMQDIIRTTPDHYWMRITSDHNVPKGHWDWINRVGKECVASHTTWQETLIMATRLKTQFKYNAPKKMSPAKAPAAPTRPKKDASPAGLSPPKTAATTLKNQPKSPAGPPPPTATQRAAAAQNAGLAQPSASSTKETEPSTANKSKEDALAAYKLLHKNATRITCQHLMNFCKQHAEFKHLAKYSLLKDLKFFRRRRLARLAASEAAGRAL